MLGRRNPQRSLFEAQGLPHRVPADSFYGRMAAVNDVLFNDDDLKDLYCPDNGRPSLPPSLMSGVLLLQFYDDVSDEEAVERLLFDLRWKIALNLPLDYPGFDPSSLTYFRRRSLDPVKVLAETRGLWKDHEDLGETEEYLRRLRRGTRLERCDQ